ncbi:class I adenylate-forming enzyme family protein [Aquisalibacillus elongatus]|uniref:Crotonobetaine/carnitine-CoA ligase n=1 Tax=Aquisalibacillus elongatus TaxID=485577 RepID=A0A3N5CBJ8_9BACI|nr:AMP-binding protein [Aquisalibacillus elongatus]RPF54221.1 crotonobetaine/carnitine-CoA ligase [Aquisalibacillus elongatus]
MLTHGNLSIYDYLNKQAKKYEAKTFLYYEDQIISYSDMLKRANQLASWFKKQDIQKGDVVAVMLKNQPFFYDVWFGCAAIGAILLPINTASTPRELEYFLEHSESKGIFYDSDLVDSDHLNVMEKQHLYFYHENNKNLTEDISLESEENHNDEVNAHDVCSICYTSGTTSKPKGVLITHENYLYAGHSSVLYQQLTSDDRYLIFLPLFHVNSQYYTSMATLVVGGSIILLEKFSANTFWDTVQKYNPTVSSFVATIIKILLRLPKHPAEEQHNIRQIGYGLFVNKNEIDEFQERFNIKLFQWYGMTESITTNITTPLYEEMPVDPNTGILSIGKPGLGQEVKIIHQEGYECEAYEVGEIVIKSPSLMKGYYKNKEETDRSLRNGWLYTGDYGYMNEEGFIWFVDRNKDLIKRAGENISSVEIENQLYEYPDIVHCAVIGEPDEIREEKVVAYIQTENQNLTKEDIIEFSKERLAEFKIPEEILFVDDFPRTSIGKIQKHLLRNKEQNR